MARSSTHDVLARIRNRVALVAALIGPVIVGALLVPFRSSFASTAAALTMVVVIAALAVLGNRANGVLASLSGALWFDFFLTRPYYRFEISHRHDLETTIAIFVVGLIITELAARSRHHWRAANDSTQYVSMIHDVAELAAASVPVDVIIDRACDALVKLLSLRSCRFDRFLSDPPLARIQANGEVVNVGMRWPAREIGIPGPESEILAQWRGQVQGRFVVTPTRGAPVTLEQRIVAVALVDVVAAYVMDEHHAS
jgi:Domain of unknown function (DUF4118)